MTTEGERIFQPGIVLVKYENSGHHNMSGINNIGLFVVAFRTGSSGQVLVFFYTHNLILITICVNTISISCD